MQLEFLISAFLIGAAGSLHCVGMCGPLMLSNVFIHGNLQESILRWNFYHLGRILIYAMWGVLFGTIGISIKWFGMQQNISVALGLGILSTMLLIRIFPIVENKLHKLIPFTMLSKKFYPKKNGSTIKSAFVGGLLNGILPCGLVYVALAGATAMQNPIKGSIFMAAFGIGTLPMLILVLIIGSKLQLSVRKYFIKWYPIIIGLIGIMLIVRGLNLGSMLSPALIKNSRTIIQCAIH
jgi:sulfite exporter TauE/SafE